MAFGAYLTGKVKDTVMVMDFVPGVSWFSIQGIALANLYRILLPILVTSICLNFT